ncbi:MAG: hypothetical protein P4L40_10655 [Terracidiphilus sp.]|nr:hypothetical protein [Terracidiphilus sp.]
MIIAGLINVKRWPEGYAAGLPFPTPWLDYVGNSHQIMHVLSVAAICVTYVSGCLDCEAIAAAPSLAAAAAGQFSWIPWR